MCNGCKALSYSNCVLRHYAGDDECKRIIKINRIRVYKENHPERHSSTSLAAILTAAILNSNNVELKQMLN